MFDINKVRYFPPSRVERAPFGTVLYVATEDDGHITYIQLSENPDEPDWQKGRNVLEKIFQDLFKDANFLQICIKLDKDKNKNDFLELSNIIKNKYSLTGDQP